MSFRPGSLVHLRVGVVKVEIDINHALNKLKTMSVQVALSILTLPLKPRVDRSAHNIAAFIIAVFLFFPVLSFDVGCGHGGDDLVRHDSDTALE
jgi:hypothetical protein